MLCCSDSELKLWMHVSSWLTSCEINFCWVTSVSFEKIFINLCTVWCFSILDTHLTDTVLIYAKMYKIFIAQKSYCACCVLSLATISRDAPIIGIGRLLCWYRPIVIYYVLRQHWILKLYFFLIWTDDTNFCFIVIYANSANMLVALCSYALIYYIMQQNICMIDTVFGIKVRMSGLCINR